MIRMLFKACSCKGRCSDSLTSFPQLTISHDFHKWSHCCGLQLRLPLFSGPESEAGIALSVRFGRISKAANQCFPKQDCVVLRCKCDDLYEEEACNYVTLMQDMFPYYKYLRPQHFRVRGKWRSGAQAAKCLSRAFSWGIRRGSRAGQFHTLLQSMRRCSSICYQYLFALCILRKIHTHRKERWSICMSVSEVNCCIFVTSHYNFNLSPVSPVFVPLFCGPVRSHPLACVWWIRLPIDPCFRPSFPCALVPMVLFCLLPNDHGSSGDLLHVYCFWFCPHIQVPRSGGTSMHDAVDSRLARFRFTWYSMLSVSSFVSYTVCLL